MFCSETQKPALHQQTESVWRIFRHHVNIFVRWNDIHDLAILTMKKQTHELRVNYLHVSSNAVLSFWEWNVCTIMISRVAIFELCYQWLRERRSLNEKLPRRFIPASRKKISWKFWARLWPYLNRAHDTNWKRDKWYLLTSKRKRAESW